jgi:putative transposase
MKLTLIKKITILAILAGSPKRPSFVSNQTISTISRPPQQNPLKSLKKLILSKKSTKKVKNIATKSPKRPKLVRQQLTRKEVIMPSVIRMHPIDGLHFITNRTEHEMFMMHPSNKTKHIILTWLGRALQKNTGIRVYAFIFLSNHYHMLLKDEKGELAEFMSYFQGNVALNINKKLGRKGNFWSRRYHDLLLGGTEEFWNRYCYIACNAVKAGLVSSASMWPGENSLKYVLSNKKIKVSALRQSDYGEASRFGKKVDKKDFEENIEFELAIPPDFEGKPHEELVEYVKALVEVGENKYKKERCGKPFLGLAKIMKQTPQDIPKKVARKNRENIFCLDKKKLKKFKAIYANFVKEYRECMKILLDSQKSGNLDVEIYWPLWCYIPACLKPVGYD